MVEEPESFERPPGLRQVAAVFVDAEPFLLDQHKKILVLAARRAVPVTSILVVRREVLLPGLRGDHRGAPAPSHPIPRGFAGPSLLAMVLVNR